METATAERTASGRPGRLLALISLGTLAAMGGRLVFAPLLPAIVADLSISPAQAGAALSVLWACSALIQYPGGRVSDDLSRKTVLVASLVLMSVGAFLVSGVGSYPGLLAATVCFGFGMGLYVPTSFAYIADLFDRRRGTAFGINIASINLGGLLVAVLASVVLAVATWQTAFLAIAVGLVPLTLAMHLLSDQPYALGTSTDFRTVRTVRRLLGDRALRRTMLAAALVAFCWQSAASFVPTFLLTAKGTTAGFANAGFAGLFLVGLFVNPVAGRLGDRLGHRRVAAGGAGVGAVGVLVLVAAVGRPALLVGVGLLGAGLAAFWPSANTSLMSLFPETNKGGDFGAVRSAYMAFGSLGPGFVGVVASGPGYVPAFLGLAVSLVLAAVVLAATGR